MWSKGVEVAQIERAIAQGLRPGYEDTGPVRQAARRTGDVMRAVMEIGLCVNPGADFGRLPELLPAQLELGIVEGLVPIAQYAEVPLGRSVYLGLAREDLTTVDAIIDADEAMVLRCVDNNSEQLKIVLEAAERAKNEAEQRFSLDDLVPPLTD
jgi:hypothetical protein